MNFVNDQAAKVNARPLSMPSLAETTAQHILDAICDGKFDQDEPFPSQYQLCEWFGVSRSVIREATQILVSKGILDVKHGKRITVRPPSHEQITETVSLTFRRSNISLLEVLELRQALEVEAAGFAAKRANDEDIAKMKECQACMEDFMNEEQGYVDADVAFHKAIFTAAKQPAFELVLNSLSDYLRESRKSSYRGPENTKRAIAAHRLILQAIEQHDERAAREAMRKHLDETAEDLRQADQSRSKSPSEEKRENHGTHGNNQEVDS